MGNQVRRSANLSGAQAPVARWVGLDTGGKTTAVCITSEVGTLLMEAALPSKIKDIHAFLAQQVDMATTMIGTEACATSIALVKGLRLLGYQVVVFDASKVRRFASIWINKTDRKDARSIAEVTRLGHMHLTRVHIKSDESWTIRMQLVSRHHVVKQRVGTEQLIRSILGIYGGRLQYLSQKSDLFRLHVEKVIGSIRDENSVDLTPQLLPLIDLCGRLRADVSRLEAEIRHYAETNTTCRRFMQIPGVSAITAVSFYTAIDEPHRFRRSSDVPAYLGLTPKIAQTGDTSWRPRISKRGNSLTRSHLVTAATVMLYIVKKDFALRSWGLDRAKTIGSQKARIAVARKLAVIMFNMWRNDTDFVAEGLTAPPRRSLPPDLRDREAEKCDLVKVQRGLGDPAIDGETHRPIGASNNYSALP